MIKRYTALLIALIVVVSCFATSCGGAKLEPQGDGTFYCKKSGVSYKLVDFQYYPVALGEEYAELMDGVGDRTLYTIRDVAPERWLATANGDLYCAVGEKIPTLAEMAVDNILICRAGTEAIVSIADVKKAEAINSVTEAFTSGMTIKYPHEQTENDTVILRFSSSKYPWLYYELSYVEFVVDICESDYPEDLSTYEYRDVDDSVEIKVVDEFECWFNVSDASERLKYEEMAKDAGIQSYTITKPVDSRTETFVFMVFEEKNTKEECLEAFIKSYAGGLTKEEINSAFSKIYKTEKVTKVEYNYGKYFVHDPFTDRCVKVDETLHNYRHYIVID